MNKSPYQLACELKEILNNDFRIISLNKIEKKMNEDKEAMALAYKKDMAVLNYSDALKFCDENSREAATKRKLLYEAKRELESLPLVIEYLKAYQQVRELYMKINEILFKDLSPSLCPKE